MDQPNTKATLDSYITDMLALEDHIMTAINAQMADMQKDFPEYATAAAKAADVTNTHIAALQALKMKRNIDTGSAVADAVKRAGSAMAGLGAAAINLVRSDEKLSKNLRDDYTAYSLATVGYEMLLTTSLAFNDQEVAQHARVHFADYAKVVMELSRAIPSAVVKELQARGFPLQPDSSMNMEKEISDAWKSSSERTAAKP
jgi:hypothetical protein